MKDLIAGQKIKLSDLTQSKNLTIGIRLNFNASVAVDVSCFGVDQAGQLSDDRYMIFFNQKSSPCNSIAITNGQGSDMETFSLDLATLPDTIKKLVFTATIEGSQSMSQLSSGYLRLSDGATDIARFNFDGSQFSQERAIMMGEIYFKDVWRFGAVGQGFNGGLSALLAHFGGEEIDAPVPSEPPPASPFSAPPPTPEKSSVSLSKVTLEKKGDRQTISLEKTNTIQPIRVNLNWDGNNAKGGFFGFAKPDAPDLDLGCFFRMLDGQIGVIQPLGNSFGSKTHTPYILLDKDDRSGSASDGENLTIYRPDMIDFMVIFAMIYEGASDFTSVNGRLTIKDPKGNQIFIRLNAPDPSVRFCVAASFKKNGSNFDLVKEEKYFKREHIEADEYYGFGFKWTSGSK